MSEFQREARFFAELPVMPLREVVMLPRTIMPLFVGREASIKAIELAQSGYNKQMFLVAQREPDVEKPGADDLSPVGVVCKVLQMLRLPDGTIKVLFEGLHRARWTELREEDNCLMAMLCTVPESESRPEEREALVRTVQEALEEYAKNNKKLTQEALMSIMALRDAGPLADAVVPHLKVDYRKKQEVLEIADVTERLERVYELLQGEVALASVEKRIKNRVKVQMERNQREYYLSEQLKAINKEMGREDDPQAEVDELEKKLEEEKQLCPVLANDNGYQDAERECLREICPDISDEIIEKIQKFALKQAEVETDRATYQAMEALVHNLNTMNSRAGAQIPFSSINYGTDTSPEGRMVIKNVLLATEAGLGNGETPIFPIHIFKVKDGLNYNEGDPNYDLFKLACRVSAKRLFPNFSFIDAPYNLQYYKPGDYNTEIAYMGCRTRVIGNVYDPTREIVTGRGNLSFTSINLPRLGILAGGDIVKFFEMLEDRMNLVVDQLLYRFKIQSQKKVKNYPFLMGQGIWIDSEKLNPNDTIGEVLKHGTLSVGFIGLAECLKALIGVHHGESKEAQELGLRIIGRMRARMDEESKKTGLNFSLLATPAEGLSGRFVKIDRKKFGKIEGVTDREYYTNSFHIPVYFPINAFRKIKLEAPYHALTNAGHISYVELDGDPLQNLEAFEQIIRCMKESGIGYGSINHPVDRDPCCGYTGIIGDVCPKCGRSDHGDNTRFERIRRITGYLVGTVDRFNNGKRAEERDRVKHSVSDDDAEI